MKLAGKVAWIQEGIFISVGMCKICERCLDRHLVDLLMHDVDIVHTTQCYDTEL